MSCFAFHKSALPVLLLFGSQFTVPAQTISSSAPGSAVTTGIVGVAVTQSVRLNVLNLQPVIPGVAAVVCPATLEFYDDAGALLKQAVVANISPATAASLVFKPAVPTTAVNSRAQIRAVVFTPSPVVVNPGMASPPTALMPVSFACNLMSSLEIIDDSTGATHLVTTDFRSMPTYRMLAMPLGGR
jgi:hypothetical protein